MQIENRPPQQTAGTVYVFLAGTTLNLGCIVYQVIQVHMGGDVRNILAIREVTLGREAYVNAS